MQDQLTSVVPELERIECPKCGEVVLYGTFYGIVTVRCRKCHAFLTLLDGTVISSVLHRLYAGTRGIIDTGVHLTEELRAQMRRRLFLLRQGSGAVENPAVEEMMTTLEARWEESFRRRSLRRAQVAVGLRFDVFVRDGFKCRYCGISAQDGAALEADHVMPRVEGGKDELTNLVTACGNCNRGKWKRVLDESTLQVLDLTALED